MRLWIPLLLLIGVIAGYSIWWFGQAQTLRTIVTDSARHTRDQLKKQGGWMNVGYQELRTTNFPFRPGVRIIQPCIGYNQPSQRISKICAPEMELRAETMNLEELRLILPETLTADETLHAGGEHHYQVTITHPPLFATQHDSANGLATKFAIGFPEKITLAVQRDGAALRYSQFDVPYGNVKVWRPAHYKLADPTDLFMHLLAEISDNGSTQPPSTN